MEKLQNANVRYAWLRIMYTITIIIAGGFGIAILLMPDIFGRVFGWPDQDPIVFGVVGSVLG